MTGPIAESSPGRTTVDLTAWQWPLTLGLRHLADCNTGGAL